MLNIPAVTDHIQFIVTDASLDSFLAAKSIQPYSVAAPIAGYHHRDPNYHRQLGRCMEEDHAAGKPYRSSLIINAKIGRPGGQYFDKARQLGSAIPNTPAEELAFWESQLKKLGVK